MLKMVGALFLAFAAAAWGMALIGACPVREGVFLSLMFSGLALALFPFWPSETPAKRDVAVVAPEPPVSIKQPAPPLEPRALTEEVPYVFGSVPSLMPEVLAPAKGKKTEIRRAYEAYAQACARSGARAVAPVEFVPLMQTLCDVLDIETRRRGEYVYLLDVKVAG